MTSGKTIVCSICGSAFDPAHSTTVPFCSVRCKEIDLGRWLDEQYGLPIDRDPEPPPDEPDPE
jgi:uncharacterized protein